MSSGNRRVFFASMFGAGLLLAAADAHTPGAPRAPSILVAAELLQESSGIALLECATDESPELLELRFERITADPDPDEMRRLSSRAAQRPVNFTWNSDRGELSYAAPSVFMPPATRGAAPSNPGLASCESR